MLLMISYTWHISFIDRFQIEQSSESTTIHAVKLNSQVNKINCGLTKHVFKYTWYTKVKKLYR